MYEAADISSKLSVSPVVDQSIELFTGAPPLVKNCMHETLGIAKEYTAVILTKSMNRVVDDKNMEALGMIAAIEEVRTSPLHMSFVMRKLRNKPLHTHDEFHDWAYRNMPAGAYNTMMISYSSTGKNPLIAGSDMIDMHFAAPVAASKKVLSALQMDSASIEWVIRDSYAEVMRTYSSNYKSVAPKVFPDYALSLLRQADAQSKISPPQATRPTLFNALRVN